MKKPITELVPNDVITIQVRVTRRIEDDFLTVQVPCRPDKTMFLEVPSDAYVGWMRHDFQSGDRVAWHDDQYQYEGKVIGSTRELLIVQLDTGPEAAVRKDEPSLVDALAYAKAA
jgi:hypothetical protein